MPSSMYKIIDLKSRGKIPRLYLSYFFRLHLTRPARLFRKQGWHNKNIGNRVCECCLHQTIFSHYYYSNNTSFYEEFLDNYTFYRYPPVSRRAEIPKTSSDSWKKEIALFDICQDELRTDWGRFRNPHPNAHLRPSFSPRNTIETELRGFKFKKRKRNIYKRCSSTEVSSRFLYNRVRRCVMGWQCWFRGNFLSVVLSQVVA